MDEYLKAAMTLPERAGRVITLNLRKAAKALSSYNGKVEPEAAAFLVKCMASAGICLFAFWLGEMAGKWVASSIFEAIFGSFSSFILLGLVAPVVVWYGGKVLDSSRRVPVENLSIGLGVVLGSALADRQLEFIAPPVGILPFFIASAAYAGPNDRRVLLASALLPAMLVYIWLGISQQVCGDPRYLLHVALITMAVYIDTQMKINECNWGGIGYLPPMLVEQWKTVCVLGITDYIAFVLVSSSSEPPSK